MLPFTRILKILNVRQRVKSYCNVKLLVLQKKSIFKSGGVSTGIPWEGLLLTMLPCLFHKITLGSTRCNQSNNIKLDGVGPVDNRLGRKVEALEVLRMVGDIFSRKLRLLRRKKYVKMALIRNFCDQFTCEIA